MYPHGPRKTFYWPKRNDIIYLSKADVIAKISPPHVSRTGRVHQITDQEFESLSQIVF